MTKSGSFGEVWNSRCVSNRLPVRSRVYDLARDLAGAVKGLPEDLSDNPNYADGFGRAPWSPF